MYVYDLAKLNISSMCFTEISPASAMADFEYETHLEAELREVAEVTTDPSAADFFFVPACLSQFWASTWSFSDAGHLQSSCGNCLQTYEEQLIKGMRKVGPWFDGNPGLHLINRHRCPSHNEPKHTWIIAGGMAEAFPQLWRHPKLKYACVESLLPTTGADLDMYRDITRELQLPYFTDGKKMERPPSVDERRRPVGFAGSVRHRDWIEEEFNKADILDLGEDVGVQDPATLRSFLRGSKFALQPFGDTQVLLEGELRVGVQPSRLQIYTALHAGTPLVFTDRTQPPLRMWDWNGVGIEAYGAELLRNESRLDNEQAVESEIAKFAGGWRSMYDANSARKAGETKGRNLALRKRTDPAIPDAPPPVRITRLQVAVSKPGDKRGEMPVSLARALERYPQFISRFERAREPFIWRTGAFRQQLRRVLQVVFLAQPSLAHVQEGKNAKPSRWTEPQAMNDNKGPNGGASFDPKEENRLRRERERLKREENKRKRVMRRQRGGGMAWAATADADEAREAKGLQLKRKATESPKTPSSTPRAQKFPVETPEAEADADDDQATLPAKPAPAKHQSWSDSPKKREQATKGLVAAAKAGLQKLAQEDAKVQRLKEEQKREAAAARRLMMRRREAAEAEQREAKAAELLREERDSLVRSGRR
eukprot:Transcript_14899.p1 GENE.Transcript_14899~~Transcript_14899.p1  ORF type:complete len:709 (+),score=230.49 Transcript_14899:171-2129(+)